MGLNMPPGMSGWGAAAAASAGTMRPPPSFGAFSGSGSGSFPGSRQGLTLVHISAQPEPFLTQEQTLSTVCYRCPYPCLYPSP